MTNAPQNPTPGKTGQPTSTTHAALAGVEKSVPTAKPVNAGSSVVPSPALFGGHKGGGKKRADGLASGSPEAIAADKRKDADRQKLRRAQIKSASLPAALPSVSTSPVNAAPTVVNSQPPLPGALAVPLAVAGPVRVPWSQKILEKPARLLTKIVDRFRCWQLMQKVRKLDLTREQEKEIESDLKWRDDAISDFSVALSNCVSTEFNRRNVPGAEHSHYIDLVITGGELALVHMNTLDRLERMVAANAAKKSGGSQTTTTNPVKI